MTARWIPDDSELDLVARSIEVPEPSGERAEQNRTAILASAASSKQRSRSSRAPWLAGALAFAAAAAAAVWIGTRPSGFVSRKRSPSLATIASAIDRVVDAAGCERT